MSVQEDGCGVNISERGSMFAQKVMFIFFCQLCHYKETSVKITARYDNIYHDIRLVYLKG